jgi:hypothetical protein
VFPVRYELKSYILFRRNLRHCPGLSLEKLMKSKRNLSQDSLCLSRDSNLAPLEHKSEAVPFESLFIGISVGVRWFASSCVGMKQHTVVQNVFEIHSFPRRSNVNLS